MPESSITTVEIDPGVITAAKTYFGIRETPRMRYRDGDARVFLNRNPSGYDLILVDAYRGGYVPVHLLTREFYTLLKQRLAPGGAVAFNVHDGIEALRLDHRTLERGLSGGRSLSDRPRRGDRRRNRHSRAGRGDAGRAGRALQETLRLSLSRCRK